MSLTAHLRNTQSPVRLWMDRTFDKQACCEFVTEINNVLATRVPVTTIGSIPGLAGTAFDYAARWTTGSLTSEIVATVGAAMCASVFELPNAPAVASAVIDLGNSAPSLYIRSQCSIALAWFEQVARIGKIPAQLQLTLGTESTAQHQATALLRLTPEATVRDVEALAGSIPAVWNTDLHVATQNPVFSGSALVGGADADWITGRTLWETKTSADTRPFGREHLLQAFGYVLLDGDNMFSLDHVGWYYARHQWRACFPLDELARRLIRHGNFISLRVSFWQEALRCSHVGV